MNAAATVPLKFQVGARTLFALPRRLVRVPCDLADVRAGRAPALPALPSDAHGYLVTSLPVQHAASVASAAGLLAVRRQSYTRYHVDLSLAFDAWFAGLSGNARSGLKRKAKKLAAANGGTLDVERFAAPEALERFHAQARALSAKTYQERLMDAGLPDSAAFRQEMLARGAADCVRAWLLRVRGEPVAYLYCPAVGDTLIYDRLGHDPAWAEHSPGAVLQVEALRDLMDERRFAWFDFTEGEGRHKRQFASGGAECVDLLLLRPTLVNRAAVTALTRFDALMAWAKRAADRPALAGLAHRVRRG